MILRRCAKTILLKNVYCAKSNPEPASQSGSRVHKGLETRALCSIWECTLVTAIAIWTLTQPLTCKIGSSIFAAMSRLKVASTTCASLPIIPSTDRTNKEKNFSRGSAAHVCPSSIVPTQKKRVHSLFHIELQVKISKSDINDGIRLDLP